MQIIHWQTCEQTIQRMAEGRKSVTSDEIDRLCQRQCSSKSFSSSVSFGGNMNYFAPESI